MDGGPQWTHKLHSRRHPLRLRIARLGRKIESAFLDGVQKRTYSTIICDRRIPLEE
jgi:hypothetical protein